MNPEFEIHPITAEIEVQLGGKIKKSNGHTELQAHIHTNIQHD